MGNKSSSTVSILSRTRAAREEQRPESGPTLIRGRKMISKYLRRIGKEANLDLNLDAYGFCYIPFKKFLIIIGVPDDQSGVLYFKTMVFDLDSASGISKLHKRVAAANLTEKRLGDRGSFLCLEGDEISLFFLTPIKGLSYRAMAESLEDFMETAVRTNAALEAIR